MTNLIKNLGCNIYIRDNSFLGFPTYSIYVPGMSELHNVISLHHYQNTYDKYQQNFICSQALQMSNGTHSTLRVPDLDKPIVLVKVHRIKNGLTEIMLQCAYPFE